MTAQFTPAILIHTLAALAALVVGAGVFLARKGTRLHRYAGRGWELLMLVTAVSTWWIRSSGSFSWIHGLSVTSLVLLAAAVWFAITGNIGAHRKTVTNLYVGALVIAGAFTLLPQRLLGQLVWSSVGLI